MINQLESEPQKVINEQITPDSLRRATVIRTIAPSALLNEQITPDSLRRVTIGRIDIQYLSGKQSKDVVISL